LAAARALTMVPAGVWNGFGNAAGGLLPRPIRSRRLGEKVHKGAIMLSSESLDELYDGMLSLWRDPSEFVIGAPSGSLSPTSGSDQLSGLGGVERMMAQDMLGYLANDILVKVDRAAMAVSLETRVPLLDPEVVEFAWRLPLGLKMRGSKTKWLLRQVLYRHVPPVLIERPKMGFGVPIDSWMRGPLRDWVEALIDERRLREEGFFYPETIRKAWDEHLAGRANQFKLWSVLMFQAWLEARRGGAPASNVREPALAG
jgi:asparagine synthase (glutamine-hydrolysing)